MKKRLRQSRTGITGSSEVIGSEHLNSERNEFYMIKELHIKNFKGWQDTGLIKMAPLTVFFGTNSSGKSSIGHLLLLLKQTVDNLDRKTAIFPGTSKSPLQIGSIIDVIYQHDKNSQIEFEYLWNLDKPLTIMDVKSTKEYKASDIRFSAAVGLKGEITSEVKSFTYDMYNVGEKAFSINMKKDPQKPTYDIEADNYELVKNVGRAWNIDAPVRFYGYPETVIANYQNADFFQEINLRHEVFFSSIYYLGPLRQTSSRLYTWSGSVPDSVGYSGENTISAILAAKNRRLSTEKYKHKKLFEEIIAMKLQEMGLLDEFVLRSITDEQRNYEVKVRSAGSKNLVDLPDVGFGVSQVLPVIVQLFYAPANSIIIMEQPEIHLHPSAQSVLADVMIDAINAREDGERNIQLIVETHSEHFLRRLQRRVAEGRVEDNQISAYFATRNKMSSVLDPLEIDTYGNIKNWPIGFFGDEMGDIAAQSLAAISKRAKGGGA